jgi:hypothetical protein
LDWRGQDRTGTAVADGRGPERTGSDRIGLDRSGPERSGPERSGCRGGDRKGVDWKGAERNGFNTTTSLTRDNALVTNTEKGRYKYVYSVSDDCRRKRSHKEAFMKWLKKRGYSTKPPTEALVKEFRSGSLKHLVEQDVRKAAAIYYRQEAQYWIRHVQVTKIDLKIDSEKTKPVRAWFPLNIEYQGKIPDSNYESMKRIANKPEHRETVLAKCKSDLRAWLMRYERYDWFLEEFSPVIKQIHKLLERRDA